jgi:hypothetical protein
MHIRWMLNSSVGAVVSPSGGHIQREGTRTIQLPPVLILAEFSLP